MSEGLHNDDGSVKEPAGSVSSPAEPSHKQGSNGVDMGDIGNPPTRDATFTQIKEGTTETEEKVDSSKQENHTRSPSPIPPAPISSTPPTDTSSVDENINMDDVRLKSPTPPQHNDNDNESVESEGSNVDSPAPKRAFVLSGKDSEDTDDFLLSTMLAIRTAVLAGTRDATKTEASPEDFCASRKHKISMAGDRKVEVKDYAPVVFTLIRRHFGVSIPAYLLSWSDSRLAKSKSVGKSDSMFIHSPDNKFVLKTLGRDEAKRLCKILRPYYEHMVANKDTFMSRIYGLHRMSRRRGQSDIYFAIFNNVFDSGHPLSEIYDLKGSTVGRRASSETPTQRRSSTSFEFRQVRKAIAEESVQPAKKPTVMKDLDFTRKLHVGPENRAKVLAQLGRDCKFLAQHQLMDYSLLIGVRRTDTINGINSPRSDSPTPPSRAVTPICSPSPDQRDEPMQKVTPSSPRARHSIVGAPIPAAHRERMYNTLGHRGHHEIPGLLFFLESTKAATSKSLRETKRDRRKSVSEGGGNILLQQELNAIDEDDEEPTPQSSNDNIPKPDEPNQPNQTNGFIESTPIHTPQGTPPKPSITTTTHEPSITNTHTNSDAPPVITINPAEDDDTEGTPPDINVIPPPSPILRNANGNSGEPGHSYVPPLKTATIDKPPSPIPNGTANGTEKTADEDSDDSSLMEESQTDSPRLQSLGMMTVNSVPNFNYFNTANKSGTSSLRIASPNNHTPTLMKRSNRSASLSSVNLDPLCGNPHIPFYKNTEGGIPGATFVTLEPQKSNEIYYIGLIDFLQKYNKKKKLAGFAKSFKYEKDALSTVDPVFYMERFLKMTEKSIVE